MKFHIAIDGPVAAGKSTVARRLADRLQFVYIDTGAMYRAVTLVVLRKEISLSDEGAIADLVRSLAIDVRRPLDTEDDGRLSTILVDGEDISWEARGEAVNQSVAQVASLPRVREALVPKQQEVAEGKQVVMEGRDTTYVVLPEAELKIFLDGSEEVRARRYFEKLRGQGQELTYEEALVKLQERDRLDKSRAASPLKIVPGAWVLDTSELSIDGVVSVIAERTKELLDTHKERS